MSDYPGKVDYFIAQARSVMEGRTYSTESGFPITQLECIAWLADELERVKPVVEAVQKWRKGKYTQLELLRICNCKLGYLYPTLQNQGGKE